MSEREIDPEVRKFLEIDREFVAELKRRRELEQCRVTGNKSRSPHAQGRVEIGQAPTISGDGTRVQSRFVNAEDDQAKVVLPGRIVLPGRGEKLITGKLRGNVRGTEVMITPVDVGIQGVAGAYTICRNKGPVLVRILNINDFAVELPKGTVVGIATGNIAAPEIGRKIQHINAVYRQQEVNDRKFLEEFEFDHLGREHRILLENFVCSYRDIFHDESRPLTTVSNVKHRITVEDNTPPVAKRPYRIPHHLREPIDQEIGKLLKAGTIRHSDSPWSAPIVPVSKKLPDGTIKLRMCIDYRGLNAITKRDFYPLPNLHETIEQFGEAALFSVFDVTSAYHQIEVEETDREKTAFSSPNGHYEWNRMPFGLSNAPSTFQRFINFTMSGLTGQTCLVYLDDIIVYNSGDVKDHLDRLRAVFDRLRAANVKLKPSKCKFLLQEVKYLGHIISREGLKPDPEKLEAVKAFPEPKNVKGVRSFLGLVGWYRRFIKDYANLALPLTKLTKKDTPFVIDQEVRQAICKLKNAVLGKDVLIYPNFEEPFILATDASGTGIGAVLSQIRGGHERPIAFASRKLNQAESNYSVTEQECLAVVFGIKQFRCYLYGRKFTVITDHRSLKWLLTLKDATSRLARWSLLLSEYEFDITYRQGKKHGNADALSRVHDEKCDASIVEVGALSPDMPFVPTWDRDVIKSEQDKDEFCQSIIENLKENQDNTVFFLDEDGILYRDEQGGKLVVPATFIRKALHDFHNLPMAGHPGQAKTLSFVKSRLFWPNMTADVTQYVRECRSCNERKTSPHHGRAPMQKFESISQPFERTAMDIVGPFVTSMEGNKYLLTFQDHFSKYPEAIPIPNQTAETVAKALVTHIICRHGTPKILISDKGANFMSSLMKEVCSALNIQKINTTAYHPQSNGVVERSHRTFKDTMSHFVEKSQRDWDQWVPYTLMAFRNHIHSATGYSPYFLMHGRDMVLPQDEIIRAKRIRYDLGENYAAEMMARLNQAFERTRENIRRASDRTEKYYNRNAKERNFELGDLVYLHDPAAKIGISKKLTRPWIGPYRIIEKKGPVNYRIRKVGGRKEEVVHANRLKSYFGEDPNEPQPPRNQPPDEPPQTEEDEWAQDSDASSWSEEVKDANRKATLDLIPLLPPLRYVPTRDSQRGIVDDREVPVEGEAERESDDEEQPREEEREREARSEDEPEE